MLVPEQHLPFRLDKFAEKFRWESEGPLREIRFREKIGRFKIGTKLPRVPHPSLP